MANTPWRREDRARDPTALVQRPVPQDLERQHAHIGIMVEFSIALMSKLDGINRHSFNSFRLRVGEGPRVGRAGPRQGGRLRWVPEPGKPTLESVGAPDWMVGKV